MRRWLKVALTTFMNSRSSQSRRCTPLRRSRRLEQMMPELMKSAGVTEELKARDQMKWVGLMNSLKAQAEEIILSELVYD